MHTAPRRSRPFTSLLLAALFALTSPTLFAQDESYVAEENVMIPMRDGTELAAHLFRPKEGGPFPTILMRTPYGKGNRSNG